MSEQQKQPLEELEDLRKEINILDNQILNLLKNRQEIVEKVKEFKIKNNVSFYQPDREKMILERIKNIADEKGMNSEIAKNIFKKIIQEFRNSEIK
ncbi:MAG: chorismate mutase [Nanoarchaeota archaeon]